MPAPPPRRQRPAPRDAEEPVTERGEEVWIDEGPVDPRSSASSARPQQRRSSRPAISVEAKGLEHLVGTKRAERLRGRLAEAAEAFAGERYGEARQLLAPIVREVPDLVEARELFGLALYRSGRWKEAARELSAFVELSNGSTEQHPVLADCRRALGQHAEVTRLWNELRESSPSGELVTEGRIVAAGSLADQGELQSAVRLLSKGFRLPRSPQEHQLRRGYALADLYERSGDVPQAAALFGRLAAADPTYLDVAERAAGR